MSSTPAQKKSPPAELQSPPIENFLGTVLPVCLGLIKKNCVKSVICFFQVINSSATLVYSIV